MKTKTLAHEEHFMMMLKLLPGFGCASFKKLASETGSLSEIMQLDPRSFCEVSGLRSSQARELQSQELDHRASEEILKANTAGVQIVHFFDPRYPALLKEIYDPPILLYVKGELPVKPAAAVGVVGSRVPSLYGEKTARTLSRDLALAGVVVISGMALGIDAAAHEGAILGGGPTLGVLGCGLGHVYPKENKKLSEKIIQNGALLSEYPIETAARPEYFPARNRIIAGLCAAVLVVEAKEKSGALITADFALREGRDVYAVPGNVDSPRSSGTNRLIQQGAKLITCAQDVLDELGLSVFAQNTQLPKSLSTLEDRILSVLTDEEPLFVDELIERSGVTAREAASILPVLEIRGILRQLPGKIFEKI